MNARTSGTDSTGLSSDFNFLHHVPRVATRVRATPDWIECAPTYICFQLVFAILYFRFDFRCVSHAPTTYTGSNGNFSLNVSKKN